LPTHRPSFFESILTLLILKARSPRILNKHDSSGIAFAQRPCSSEWKPFLVSCVTNLQNLQNLPVQQRERQKYTSGRPQGELVSYAKLLSLRLVHYAITGAGYVDMLSCDNLPVKSQYKYLKCKFSISVKSSKATFSASFSLRAI
jgi:hypothetical protein